LYLCWYATYNQLFIMRLFRSFSIAQCTEHFLQTRFPEVFRSVKHLSECFTKRIKNSNGENSMSRIWSRIVANFFLALFLIHLAYWFAIFIASTSFFNRQKFRIYTHMHCTYTHTRTCTVVWPTSKIL